MTRAQQGCLQPGARDRNTVCPRGNIVRHWKIVQQWARVRHAGWSLACASLVLLAGCGPASPPASSPAEGPLVTLGGGTPNEPSDTGAATPARGEAAGAGDTTPETTPDITPEAPTVATPADTPAEGHPPEPAGSSQATRGANPAGDPANSPPASAGTSPVATGTSGTGTPPAERSFRAEGPNGALRITYDDFDLLKLLQMEPVTVDCVEQMPAWLRALDGKPIRLRGYMKPGFLSEGITRFLLVRDTGLCCYGPKGKIYDLVQVTLAEGQSSNYIELTPFDVVGTFRIRLDVLDEEADDGTVNQLIIGLYHIENGRILRK
ncbi:MAG: hypothetical protein ACKOJF_08775 [Planctomycetaceae bacterium]